MKSVKILLVEDNSGDILLTKEALAAAKIHYEIEVRKDGEAAIAYLRDVVNSSTDSLPDIILLDVNLPKRNGHEVLMSIKEEEALKHIPVIMLTTSSAPLDIERAYQEHVNCYIVKPVDATRFVEVVNSIEEFWFSIVSLPKD